MFSLFIITVMIALESLFPYFLERRLGTRLKHSIPNLILGGSNGLIIRLGFGVLTLQALQWAKEWGAGLLNIFILPGYMEIVISLLLFDLWMYFWHRKNHEIYFLWRFHRMHHTDLAMDATTAVRFHPGEKIFSAILRILILPLLGMQLIYYALYNIIVSPIIIFHHSNIALPEGIDRLLRSIIVTPNMHRVHHSREWRETNSNYGTIFSFWDRIFGTFRKHQNTRMIVYGLKRFQDHFWQTIPGMLVTPLIGLARKQKE